MISNSESMIGSWPLVAGSSSTAESISPRDAETTTSREGAPLMSSSRTRKRRSTRSPSVWARTVALSGSSSPAKQ
jgi:hypothetical protein